jgi:hypothetical protein
MSFIRMIVAAILSLLSKIWAVIKQILPLIIIIVIIWFCPYIAAYLASIGAPAWLTAAVAWVGAGSVYISAAATWVWGAATALGVAGWSAFAAASFWTELAIVVGACALLAPEETQQMIDDAAALVVAVVDTVVGVVGDVLGISSGALLVFLALGAYLLFYPSDKDDTQKLGVSNG